MSYISYITYNNIHISIQGMCIPWARPQHRTWPEGISLEGSGRRRRRSSFPVYNIDIQCAMVHGARCSACWEHRSVHLFMVFYPLPPCCIYTYFYKLWDSLTNLFINYGFMYVYLLLNIYLLLNVYISCIYIRIHIHIYIYI